MSGKFVAYYRVSTARQGVSGLGLDAQRAAVRAYIGSGELVEEVTEIVSGKSIKRPQLNEAIRLCLLNGATLVIAKMDRLTRSLETLVTIQKSEVEFKALDYPDASKAMIGLFVSIAAMEAELISKRTKDALAQAKKRGVKLGGKRNTFTPILPEDRAAGIAKRREKVRARTAVLAPTLAACDPDGKASLRDIAKCLMDRKIKTPNGGKTWSPAQVASLKRNIAAA